MQKSRQDGYFVRLDGILVERWVFSDFVSVVESDPPGMVHYREKTVRLLSFQIVLLHEPADIGFDRFHLLLKGAGGDAKAAVTQDDDLFHAV